MPQAASTLVFLHIHKTAGTSLRGLLLRQFAAGRVHLMDQHYFRVQQAVDALAAREVEERRRIDLLVGHVAYGIHALLPRPSTYLTVLREPVARTLSEYYFVRSAPAPYIRGVLNAKRELSNYERQFQEHLRRDSTPANSLEAFLEMLRGSAALNLQTRMIGGFVARGGYLRPYPPLPAAALQTAKNNLRDNIAICGLVERFDESVLLMQATLGWRSACYTVENARRGELHRVPVSKATLSMIERHCALDIELYDYARALFEERLRELPDLTAARLERFRRRNRLYQGLRRAYERSGLPRARALFSGRRGR